MIINLYKSIGRYAHNLKVVGSNPTPATKNTPRYQHVTHHLRVAVCVGKTALEALWKQADAFGGVAERQPIWCGEKYWSLYFRLQTAHTCRSTNERRMTVPSLKQACHFDIKSPKLPSALQSHASGHQLSRVPARTMQLGGCQHNS